MRRLWFAAVCAAAITVAPAFAQPMPDQFLQQMNVPVGHRGEIDPIYINGMMGCPSIEAYQTFNHLVSEFGTSDPKSVTETAVSMGCRIIPPGATGVAEQKASGDVLVDLDTGGSYWVGNIGFIIPGSDPGPSAP
jgi:hypothetical protein